MVVEWKRRRRRKTGRAQRPASSPSREPSSNQKKVRPRQTLARIKPDGPGVGGFISSELLEMEGRP